MCETGVGRSRGPESSGFDRDGGLRGRFSRRNLHGVAEIWVRHVFIPRFIVSTHKTLEKHEMPLQLAPRRLTWS